MNTTRAPPAKQRMQQILSFFAAVDVVLPVYPEHYCSTPHFQIDTPYLFDRENKL